MINEKISKTYKNADVDVSLVDLKSFKVQIYGAVINPGFAEIQATTRLDEALDNLGGLHRYAEEDNISIMSKNEIEYKISLKDYLNEADVKNHPQRREGDIIKIPFDFKLD